MLTILNRFSSHTPCILWCLSSQLISGGRDPNWSALIKSKNLNHALRTWTTRLFKIHKFSGLSLPSMTSTTHSIHSNSCPANFLSIFFYNMMIVISFPVGRKSALSNYSTETKRHRVVQSLARLNIRISITKND